MDKPDESFMVIHPAIDLGGIAGQALSDEKDRQLNELFDSFLHPEYHWKARTTYSGLGAKRRLLMKVDNRGR